MKMLRTGTIRVCIMLAVSIFAGCELANAAIFRIMPIEFVTVEGEFTNISQQQLKQTIKPLVMSSFLSVDLKKIQQETTALPWIKSVVVTRIWPSTIKIRINEQQPRARWGRKQLINNKGELFSPANVDQFASLVQINGPVGLEKKLFKTMLALDQALKELDLKLKELNVSDRHSWQVMLAGGMKMKLGRNEPLKKFKLMLKAIPTLGKDKVSAIVSADLQYPNGFAVSWKPGTKIDWQDEMKQQSQR